MILNLLLDLPLASGPRGRAFAALVVAIVAAISLLRASIVHVF
jgi:hypothetical protein